MKAIKKIFLSSFSILGISCAFWIILLINPNLSYANQTQFDNITIYHNSVLESETYNILKNAIEIIQTSEIYDNELVIQLCLNDDRIYPELYPFSGGTAYAFLNKTVIYASTVSFNENQTTFSWDINNYETRKYNLTTLLAHEFIHNMQYNYNARYQISSTVGKINWKLDGHAEYIARKFKDDNKLEEKIEIYLQELVKVNTGIPIILLEDGTIQNLSYYKYALLTQYLMEERKLDFKQFCSLEENLETVYSEMLEWRKK